MKNTQLKRWPSTSSGQALKASTTSLAALGTVEEYPGHEVLREVYETVELARSGKQDIASLEDDLLVSAKKAAGAAYDDVDFVAWMRLLRVCPVRSVDFDAEGPVLEQLGEVLAVGSG
jgi:hypothetical protein